MGYLVYDADCGFCTKSAEWIAHGNRIRIRSWQSLADLAAVSLTEEMVTTAAYWIDGSGRPSAKGSKAIATALEASGSWRRPLGRVIRSRVVQPVADRVYQWVAAHRHRMPGSSGLCAMPPLG